MKRKELKIHINLQRMFYKLVFGNKSMRLNVQCDNWFIYLSSSYIKSVLLDYDWLINVGQIWIKISISMFV